ncbi:glycerophosphodiester phosphodiesterase domain-containing protein 5 isoform X2 [Kryptolebias marmoratus]|uniref:glycerophosphodiester phosphodiesterase domain-containing protein 5 isoform X2 n=1 Tax=Kryptolebias marmoratus TaxID=37003 RepID=UPI000D52F3CE|nr:glycerophosphodiester phosphodiesterase domain-containing protein 5 isoform X2 [Kryptolebias marmoratus]
MTAAKKGALSLSSSLCACMTAAWTVKAQASSAAAASRTVPPRGSKQRNPNLWCRRCMSDKPSDHTEAAKNRAATAAPNWNAMRTAAAVPLLLPRQTLSRAALGLHVASRKVNKWITVMACEQDGGRVAVRLSDDVHGLPAADWPSHQSAAAPGASAVCVVPDGPVQLPVATQREERRSAGQLLLQQGGGRLLRSDRRSFLPDVGVSLLLGTSGERLQRLRLLLAVCLLSEAQKLHLHWSHKVGILVTLTFSVAATAVLSDLWGEEWTTLLLSLQVSAPYLHVGGVFVMTSLAWPVALHVCRMTCRVRKGLILALYLAFLFALYLVPLGLYSPCIREKRTLGPAPALIGHRGAPMLAPENTLMSFEKAVEAGSDGLETDVTISFDGVPFLMHDRTLRRTTNVHEVFPNRTTSPAAMFTWSELQSLNAGSWFLSHDPFGSAALLEEEERRRAGNQSVCSLRAFLQLAAWTHKLVIFDLYQPPRGHPYRHSWIQRTLEVVHESTIESSQVLWLPSELRSLVQETDPELQQTSGSRLPLEELQRNNISKVNLRYSSMSAELTSEYAAANISTNLYVVSQAWLYSLAWCCGVHSVTTNAPQLLRTMSSPLFLMSPDEYNLMWILTDLISSVLIFVIFSFHRWRERELSFCSASEMTTDGGGVYFEFKTEMGDIWSISRSQKMSGPVTVTDQTTKNQIFSG